MREHGIEYFKDVKLVMLDIDGNISIISGNESFKKTIPFENAGDT